MTEPSRSVADPWPVRIAFVIGIVSILSAVVAWRASVASNDESAAQVRAMQASARQLQIEQTIEALVDQDERLIGRYQEHLVAARELQLASEAARGTDSELADSLDLEAQGRLALARQMERFFRAAIPDAAEDGTVSYDPAFVARNLREADVELRELRPGRFLSLADRAGTRSAGLVAAVLLLVASLFFLTIAQLIRSQARVWMLAIGGIGAFMATGAFVILEVFYRTA